MTQTNHYVDSVAGSDSNGGTSWADAWQTLPYALANCSLGATLNDVVTINLDGTFTLAGPLTFRSPTAYTMILKGKTYGVDANGYRISSAVIDLAGYNYAAGTSATKYSHIGCEIRGVMGGGYGSGAFNVGGSGFLYECKVIPHVSSTTGYLFNSVQTDVYAYHTDFISPGSHYFNALKTHLHDCLCVGVSVYGASGVGIQRTRFRNCKIETGSAINNVPFNIDHCSFYDATVEGTNHSIAKVTNSVFYKSSGSGNPLVCAVAGFAIIHGNAYKTYTESATTIAQTGCYTAPVTLVDVPFADTPNNDWTPSAELSAIVCDDGLTPGAVNGSASGGGNPIAAFAHGFEIGRSGAL